MIDNEYIRVHFTYEKKYSAKNKTITDLGLQECLNKTHLRDYFEPYEIVKKFGSVYCL